MLADALTLSIAERALCAETVRRQPARIVAILTIADGQPSAEIVALP